jgi:hypothetical protein
MSGVPKTRLELAREEKLQHQAIVARYEQERRPMNATFYEHLRKMHAAEAAIAHEEGLLRGVQPAAAAATAAGGGSGGTDMFEAIVEADGVHGWGGEGNGNGNGKTGGARRRRHCRRTHRVRRYRRKSHRRR